MNTPSPQTHRWCRAGHRSPERPRRAFVLVAVLVVILLVSMVAVSLLFRLHAEESAATAGSNAEQAWAAAMSGVYEAMRVVSQSPPGSLEWLDSPAFFKERFAFGEGEDSWYFTVFAIGDADGDQVRFGLSDEAGKLNINYADATALTKLPEVTPALADALLDFIDADTTPRPEGAEQDYYDALTVPYAVRDGPLATLEELLMVRGFTPRLFYGEDVNLNYRLEANENDGDALFPPDNNDGALDRGLRQFLTVASLDLNEDNDGLPRMELNDPTETFFEVELPAPVVQYITALRRSNVQLAHPADLLEAKAKLKDENNREVDMESGVGKEELPLLLDFFTTTNGYELPGLINVNTASAAVLQTLPGIELSTAESIVAARGSLTDEQRTTPAWLYQEDLLNAEAFRKIAPLITARTFQYRFQVIGYNLPAGRFRVLEAMIDTSGAKPVIAYLRDLTRLGLPFPISGAGEGIEGGSFEFSQAATPATQMGRANRLFPKKVLLPGRSAVKVGSSTGPTRRSRQREGRQGVREPDRNFDIDQGPVRIAPSMTTSTDVTHG